MSTCIDLSLCGIFPGSPLAECTAETIAGAISQMLPSKGIPSSSQNRCLHKDVWAVRQYQLKLSFWPSCMLMWVFLPPTEAPGKHGFACLAPDGKVSIQEVLNILHPISTMPWKSCLSIHLFSATPLPHCIVKKGSAYETSS